MLPAPPSACERLRNATNTEGVDTVDFIEARTLLGELSEG